MLACGCRWWVAGVDGSASGVPRPRRMSYARLPTMRVTCSLSSVQSVQGDASAGAAEHQHQRHEEVHAKKAPFSMDPSASANCRPDDASANCRPEDPANDSSRLLPRLVQRPSKADRHVDVPGICASNLESVYQLGEVMGKGSFAVVKTARRKRDGKLYAIKILEKTNPAFDPEALKKEIGVMKIIDHNNCIRLHEFYQSPSHMFLVLDLVTGGELFDRVIARGYYSEKDAAEVTRDVLHAVGYLHSINIVHRDLKPENLLYMSSDETVPEYNQIKVADFGLARSTALNQSPMRTMCGTPGYVAPEILDPRITAPNGYGPEVDVWSIGVILYIMLCGFPPFCSDNTVTLFRQIRRGDFTFTSPYWDNISASVKDLLCRMLVVDPKKRLTAAQCLQHPWVVHASKQENKSLGRQHRAFLLIRRLPLFEQVDPACLSEVTSRLKRVCITEGQYVVRTGEDGTCMYFVGSCPGQTIGSGIKLGEDVSKGIVRSHCLDVFVDGVLVTQLGTGDYFGEIGLMATDNKRTADVVATSKSELFELSRQDVYTVCEMYPVLKARLEMMALHRLRRGGGGNLLSSPSSLSSLLDVQSSSSLEWHSSDDVGTHALTGEAGRRQLDPQHDHEPQAKKVRREMGANVAEETVAKALTTSWRVPRYVPAHAWMRQPSLAFLQNPEVLPRNVTPVMRIGSRMGMMDDFESVLVNSTALGIDWDTQLEGTMAAQDSSSKTSEEGHHAAQTLVELGSMMLPNSTTGGPPPLNPHMIGKQDRGAFTSGEYRGPSGTGAGAGGHGRWRESQMPAIQESPSPSHAGYASKNSPVGVDQLSYVGIGATAHAAQRQAQQGIHVNNVNFSGGSCRTPVGPMMPFTGTLMMQAQGMHMGNLPFPVIPPSPLAYFSSRQQPGQSYFSQQSQQHQQQQKLEELERQQEEQPQKETKQNGEGKRTQQKLSA